MADNIIDNTYEPVIREFRAGDETYIYDFSITPIKQVLAAETLFKMHSKLFTLLPASPSELSEAIVRSAHAKALGALLLKIEPDGTIESFNPSMHSAWDALDKLTGKDFQQLEECRRDFFFNMKLSSPESTELYADIIRLSDIMGVENLKTALKKEHGLSDAAKKD